MDLADSRNSRKSRDENFSKVVADKVVKYYVNQFSADFQSRKGTSSVFFDTFYTPSTVFVDKSRKNIRIM